MVRENQTIVIEDLKVAGMVKNRRLSRAISDLGWRQFRTFLEGKCEKYGREFRVIVREASPQENRWEPTSQVCSCCQFRGGKLDLSIRKWTCLNCGTEHDRDENAAVNILVAGGHSETLNGRGGRHKSSVKGVAAAPREGHLKSVKRQPIWNSSNSRCLDRQGITASSER